MKIALTYKITYMGNLEIFCLNIKRKKKHLILIAIRILKR